MCVVCVYVCGVCVVCVFQIQLRTNSTFELHSVRRVQCRTREQDVDVTHEQAPPHLKLKGQMMMLNQQYVAFLCSPA